jgi:hypothetical protein
MGRKLVAVSLDFEKALIVPRKEGKVRTLVESSLLDLSEVPGDNERPRTRDDRLLLLVLVGVEPRRREGDVVFHVCDVLRLELQSSRNRL